MVVVSLLLTVHVVVRSQGPPTDTARVAAQVRWLDGELADGAGARMQALFPEGDFFTAVLTGLAAARTAAAFSDEESDAAGAAELIDVARANLARSGAESNAALFAGVTTPTGGVFYRGWRLLLEAEIAAVTGSPGDLDTLRRDERTLRSAFESSPSGLLESYPGDYWPCDNVVAAAALVRAAAVLGTADPGAAGRVVVERLQAHRDPATGLLPHRTTATGASLAGPQGTSQSLIQVFLPTAAPQVADDQWPLFRDVFLTERLGLVGVREYPEGTAGASNVDSGPLVLGVSLSASVVTLAAARAHGDDALARSLDQEAEVFGVPLAWGGERRYALGVVPVGDAWLAWARSEPRAPDVVSSPPSSPPASSDSWAWWAWALLALLPGLLATAWQARVRRRGAMLGRTGDVAATGRLPRQYDG